LKSWPFTGAADHFAIDDFDRHLCATSADAEGVALKPGNDLCQQRASLMFGLITE
jgi:hypothetical protein